VAEGLAEGSIYALLDDCEASPSTPTSRLYTGHVRTHDCFDPASLDATWVRVEADQRIGLHAVLLAEYEWGASLMQAGHTRWTSLDLRGRVPALRVFMFHDLRRLSAGEVDTWLAAAEGSPSPGPAGVTRIHPTVDRQGFESAFANIQERLRAGDTYQVNYTLQLNGEMFGSPIALYRRLRAFQPVRYGALIALDGDGHVLSLSPELFVRHEVSGGTSRLITKPMKGTAARTGDAAEDERISQALGADRKNRAENVMIVDLLRNDLGRIAEPGSVRVQSLFNVETYPTVFQMTSTIEARPRSGTGFGDVLRALFPCGSVTGAPKHRTMGIIAEIENGPRGLYCGAIGWVEPPAAGDSLGAFCLSVGIRTLVLAGSSPVMGTLRPARLGIGAGIVLDSVASGEFEEISAKARFLTSLDPGFALFETMLIRPGTGVRHLGAHLSRLEGSARELGFRFDPEALRVMICDRAAELLPGTADARMRLVLSKDGEVELSVAPLEPLPGGPALQGPVPVGVHWEPIRGDGFLSRHKTTWRPQYDPALRHAVAQGWFDLLFLNAAGELVEGARSNVFVKLDGRWFTPPLAAGALPGIMRRHLLSDPSWAASERILTLGDLRWADELVVCNALRGAVQARLVGAIPR
jgi:para-aminobenzoate synthetase/4-amino-4-deoxychorismate lyase